MNSNEDDFFVEWFMGSRKIMYRTKSDDVGFFGSCLLNLFGHFGIIFTCALLYGGFWLIHLHLLEGETEWSDIQRLEVSRVMMHEPTHYTFFVEMPDGTVQQHSFGQSFSGNVPEILHDVPVLDPMWIEYRTGNPGTRNAFDQLLKIHVHSSEDINGAGWDHGKLGHGQTTVVE